MLKIVTTDDGSDTLYVSGLDEHYHSKFGALRESKHIFIESGYKTSAANPVSIFEMGFGTGLNALLTLCESISDKRVVEYVAVDKYPLPEELYSRLNYGSYVAADNREYFKLIHSCRWGVTCRLTGTFSLMKIETDIMDFVPERKFDIIYFDAFGPEKQPELWSFDILKLMASLIQEGGILVTYSAKGQLKRDLISLGFKVEHLPGPPGKKQITRAVKSA